MVKFGVGLLGDWALRETARFAKIVEENGFDYVWIADESPTPPYRDVFVTLTTVALKTKRVILGTGICNPYSRHPALLSVAIATLDELSKGRAVLGLGAGGSLSLKPLGIKLWKKPLTTVKKSALTCRCLLNGETLDYDGEMIRIMGVKLFNSPKRAARIYLGPYGPKMLQLAGEIADGCLISSPFEYLPYTLEYIRKEASDAGRDFNEIDVANWLPFAVSEDSRKAKEMVKRDVSYMIADSPEVMLEKVGVTKRKANQISNMLRRGIENTTDLVTDKMVESYSIAGTPEYCVERIKKFLEAGVTQIVFGAPFGRNPVEAIRLIGKKMSSI